MSKWLTISIPTYNRSKMLDEQLTWLASEIIGFEDVCNIVVSDNCSTDNTNEIVEKWKSVLSKNVEFIHNRHSENIGGMANIVSCLKAANGKFVWSLGDDDPIQKGAIPYLIAKIKEHNNLSLILLNGNGRDKATNQIITERWFDSTSDKPSTNSASEFEHFLETCMGGVLFISSAVYRTQLVHKALSLWPDSAKNLASQAFWVAYCAARGSFIVTPTLYTECAMGIGFTDKDPQWTFKMMYRGIPEVYLRLMKSGYSKRFCFSMIINNLKSIGSWKILFGGLKRWPVFATKGFFYYVRGVAAATWVFLIKNSNPELLEEISKLG